MKCTVTEKIVPLSTPTKQRNIHEIYPNPHSSFIPTYWDRQDSLAKQWNNIEKDSLFNPQKYLTIIMHLWNLVKTIFLCLEFSNLSSGIGQYLFICARTNQLNNFLCHLVAWSLWNKGFAKASLLVLVCLPPK